jgi:hypothetical protein
MSKPALNMEVRHEILGYKYLEAAKSNIHQECLYNNFHDQLHFLKHRVEGLSIETPVSKRKTSLVGITYPIN